MTLIRLSKTYHINTTVTVVFVSSNRTGETIAVCQLHKKHTDVFADLVLVHNQLKEIS